MFGYGRSQIVISDLTRDATQFGERMNVTANEGFEALAMSELDIHHAAVRIDQGEGIELARVARIIERAEVAQSTSKRSPAIGSMRTKARRGFSCGRTLRTYSWRMLDPPS